MISTGCPPAPAPPPKEPVVHTPAPAGSDSPAAAEPAAIDVVVVAAPEKAALDGDVAEWQDLAAVEAGKPSLAIAFRPTDVLIAARLSGEAKDGVWLTVAEDPTDLPKIGFLVRGGQVADPECEYEIEYGPEGSVSKGKAHPPEVVAACKALIVKHAALEVQHRARFTRRYRVDRDGAKLVNEGAAPTAIAGAQSAFKTDANGEVTVEVKLPLSALPRVAQVPFAEIGVVAAPASAPLQPLSEIGQVPHQNLPDPVEFEPYGRLRTEVLRASIGSFYASGFSYQPGEGLHIETYHYPGYERNQVILELESLYEPKATLGDLEVGIGKVNGVPVLVSMVKGKFVSAVLHSREITPPDAGPALTLKAIVPRNGELHAFFATERGATLQAGIQEPSWYAFAIAPGGEWRPALDGAADDIPSWNEAWTFSSPDMSSFGIRGLTTFPDGAGKWTDKAVGVEVLYSWDSKSHMYVAKKKKIPAPKPPKDYKGI